MMRRSRTHDSGSDGTPPPAGLHGPPLQPRVEGKAGRAANTCPCAARVGPTAPRHWCRSTPVNYSSSYCQWLLWHTLSVLSDASGDVSTVRKARTLLADCPVQLSDAFRCDFRASLRLSSACTRVQPSRRSTAGLRSAAGCSSLPAVSSRRANSSQAGSMQKTSPSLCRNVLLSRKRSGKGRELAIMLISGRFSDDLGVASRAKRVPYTADRPRFCHRWMHARNPPPPPPCWMEQC
jgi:hypothetical protein